LRCLLAALLLLVTGCTSVSPSPTPWQTLGPASTATADPTPWVSPVSEPYDGTPTAPPGRTYPVPASRISSGCTPAPAPVTPAQLYLASRVTPLEYCYAYHMIQYESAWNQTLQVGYAANPEAPCGLPQAYWCSKMSQCRGLLSWGCKPVPDWATNFRGQIEWLMWWVYVRMAPTAKYPAYIDGGPMYGSFEMAACHIFGCWTGRVIVYGVGWY
jgi:hypothetical protein